MLADVYGADPIAREGPSEVGACRRLREEPGRGAVGGAAEVEDDRTAAGADVRDGERVGAPDGPRRADGRVDDAVVVSVALDQVQAELGGGVDDVGASAASA